MRKALLGIAVLSMFTVSLQAQTAEEIIAKYIKTVGGAGKIHSLNTLRRSGKFTGGGGFEAVVMVENKRPNMVREEFSMQGLTGISAYDGKAAWKIEPWGGKKDAEPLGEEEMKSILEDADFDSPIIDFKSKGNKVEYVGMEPVEGTDALKVKVMVPNGDVYFYYMDTDYYVPIKIETKRMVRGAEREYETTLGDYKEVQGRYFPFSVESNVKGSADRSKVTYETIEANIQIDDARFQKPAAAPAPVNK